MKWWITLARYAVPQFRSLLAIVVLMLVGVGLGLLAPWPLKLIVDYVLTGKQLPSAVTWIESLPGANSPKALIAWLAGATVAIFLTRRVAGIMQNYIKAGAGGRMAYDLARDLFDHLQETSLLFHQTRKKGDLVRRVTADTGCVRQLVMQVYLPLLTSIVTVISMFIVMWQMNPALAIFAIAMVIPLAFIIRFFSGPMSDRKYREWELQGEIASLAEQTLTAIPVVQAFGREEYEDRRFKNLAKATVNATLCSEVSQHQFQLSTGTVTAIAKMIVLLVGGMAVLHGGLSVGSLLVLVTYFAALYSPIETLAYLSEGYASASAGARRVLEILESDHLRVADRPDAQTLPASCSTGFDVSFQNITFGYQPGRPVLHELSLQAKAGDVIALVGPTGAGKSTLVSLLPRFFDPWKGAVYFNQTDIRDITLASLRQQVAIVAQEPLLLPLTIAENIAYGRPDANRDQIVAAAVAANADPFIQKLPAGYDNVIGERGVTLSGGEKQRLSIARALLKDAPVLILDEPTSALDALTEKMLLSALEHLIEGRTTFIIAHRLSTIRRADQILFIKDGRCVEQGTHDELLRLRGRYSRFHDFQMRKNADKNSALAGQSLS